MNPAEAFVVSRIDGATSVGDIAEQTGRSLDDVQGLLERLVAFGAVVLDVPSSGPERRSPGPAAPRTSGSMRMGPIIETKTSDESNHPAASLYDPAELDEDVEIELPRRRQILDLYYRLEHLTHYEIFGVSPAVDKKAIKAAYFDVVNVFHPDRYFGKKLGAFKPKLEKVFARLTEAYDVLSRQARRTEYDAYLLAQSKTRAFDAGQLDNTAHQAALDEVMRRIQAEASAVQRAPSVPPPLDAGTPPSRPMVHQSVTPPGMASPSSGALRPSASMRPSDPDARRRALARKLGRAPGDTKDPPSSSPSPAERELAAAQDGQRREWAASELKRRYQDALHSARSRQVEVYTRAARLALEKGDSVGAANALRIAASLAPDDASLTEQLSEVAGRAKQELSSSYLEQAHYEERDEKWLAAARSYGKALDGRPEAQYMDKVAHCLLMGDGNLREAGEMAKRAVMAQPENARFRVTLARFYLKAGMKQSAEGEISRAATLAPTDDKVTDWVRRLRRELG